MTASQEDIYTAAMTLAAEVTTQWVNIISQRMQKRLLEGQLKTDLTYLELVELRFRKGMASALDVLQQKQVVEKIKARMPLVEVQESLLLNSMALLLGRAPAQDLKITRSELPVLDELPATGIPADVLSNRPDIRSKGLRLKALDWKVASARADRLPSLNLSATAKLSAESLDLLLDNWLLGLASSLTAPIFDGGRRKAEVDRQEALADQNLASYRATVLTLSLIHI